MKNNNAVFAMLNMKRKFCNPDLDFTPKKTGTKFKKVRGMWACYQSSDGQLYKNTGSGLQRINHDGTRQKRRGN